MLVAENIDHLSKEKLIKQQAVLFSILFPLGCPATSSKSIRCIFRVPFSGTGTEQRT